MSSITLTLTQEGLSDVATALGNVLRIGDVIALWGDLGTGKTTFSRFLIQALVGKPVDVPSPTFTLLQIYEAPQAEIWHCDLYRLKAPEEAYELGLEDAFHQTICLIEWPERLGYLLPHQRIDIAFEIVDEVTRKITFTLTEPNEHSQIQNILQSFRGL